MHKTLLVARREFKQRIRSRGFLLQLILPPLIALVIGLVLRVSNTQSPNQAEAAPTEPQAPLGYVDQAELITIMPSDSADSLQPFMTEAAAATALGEGRIDAYYVIPPDYRATGAIRRVAAGLPIAPPDAAQLRALLVANLLEEVDPSVRAQVETPFNAVALQTAEVDTVTESSAGTTPEVAESSRAPGEFDLLPLLVALLVLMPLFTSGGYLFQSLVEEKSNRVMEILLLSVPPRQLLTGKLLGLGALTLMQFAVWGAIGLIALPIMNVDIGAALAATQISWADLPLMALYAAGGFALYAALMGGIGAITADLQNNRGWVFMLTLPILLPIYFWTAIVGAPNSPLAVSLSLIPFSAPVTMLMRITATNVPPWQVAVSLLLLALTSAGIIWLMARLFQAQTLLSGESLSPRRAWKTVAS